MGQYYKAINVDTGEWANAHQYDSGVKLMEHSYVNNEFVMAVKKMLMPGGRWHKARIVWAGDYGEMTWKNIASNHVEKFAAELDDKGKLYNTNSFDMVPVGSFDIECPWDLYLVNHDKKLYISYNALYKQSSDKEKQSGDPTGWDIDPLPLLTADGNGAGGGDYSGLQEEICGDWAADHISIEEKAPKGYKEFKITFREER